MEIRKRAKLRPGQSYPLGGAKLAAALEEGRVSTPVVLHQRCERWWSEGVLFRADFYPPQSVGAGSPERGETLHLTCRSVASADRLTAAAYLEATVFDELVAWIQALEAVTRGGDDHGRPSRTWSWPPSA